jgi:hypothetical protein
MGVLEYLEYSKEGESERGQRKGKRKGSVRRKGQERGQSDILIFSGEE